MRERDRKRKRTIPDVASLIRATGDPGYLQIASSSHKFDPRMMTRGSSEALVAREQRRIERLGESDVDSIIGREIVPQLPDARQQKAVRIATQRKIGQVGERLSAALVVDLTGCRIAADHMGDFDVEQMRRMERPSCVEQPTPHRFCCRRTEQHLEDGRGVDDDHECPRFRSAFDLM